ncbi:succinylglutamate desuccinylase/aspartoacylase family protein [Carnobacteriaceae bacterium zg-ZUI78]|nr:succinylglutamate desuccinylase/aspartoacylase family protein [Carnobacteriaceae bacterium zg-ZUI78]
MTILKEIIKTLEPGSIYQSDLYVREGVSIPFTILKGKTEDKVIGVTGAVHGSEYVGLKVMIDLIEEIDVTTLNGTLCFFHVVNMPGFLEIDPCFVPEDTINLNRIFQDKEHKEILSYQIKQVVQDEVFSVCQFIIDLHGGNLTESLLPHCYYSVLASEEVMTISKKMALASGIPVVYASHATGGLYQSASIDYGIPSVILEQGENGKCTCEDVRLLKEAVCNTMMYLLDGIEKEHTVIVFDKTYVLSSEYQGCWFSYVEVGTYVEEGQLLGEIRSVHGVLLQSVIATQKGLLLYKKAVVAVEKDESLVTIVY